MERKSLKDLTLLDRFLFAEAVEDPETMQILLEIILGEEIVIENLPQTEKEQRKSPRYRHIRLDVWAKDENDRIYDTEVQRRDTGNLPKRSRYYQGLIDGKLLEPGTVDFNLLNDVFIILITPFDLFGSERYRYTFRMRCEEEGEIILEDGAVRIFLNTHGKNKEEVRPELIEFLNYVEKTNELQGEAFQSERVTKIQRAVQQIKSNEQIGVKYMQEWEERQDEIDKAIEADREKRTLELIQKKQAKGKNITQIADELEMTEEEVQRVLDKQKEMSEN